MSEEPIPDCVERLVGYGVLPELVAMIAGRDEEYANYLRRALLKV